MVWVRGVWNIVCGCGRGCVCVVGEGDTLLWACVCLARGTLSAWGGVLSVWLCRACCPSPSCTRWYPVGPKSGAFSKKKERKTQSKEAPSRPVGWVLLGAPLKGHRHIGDIYSMAHCFAILGAVIMLLCCIRRPSFSNSSFVIMLVSAGSIWRGCCTSSR